MTIPTKGKILKLDDVRLLQEFDPKEFTPSIISSLNRALQKVISDALAPLGLIIPDWRVLICLARVNCGKINDIVDYTSLPQPTVSRSIARLYSRGLIKKGADETDNRIVNLDLTDAGLKVCATAVRSIISGTQETLDGWQYDKTAEWVQMSSDIRAIIEDEERELYIPRDRRRSRGKNRTDHK